MEIRRRLPFQFIFRLYSFISVHVIYTQISGGGGTLQFWNRGTHGTYLGSETAASEIILGLKFLYPVVCPPKLTFSLKISNEQLIIEIY